MELLGNDLCHLTVLLHLEWYAKPWSEQMMTYYQLHPKEHNSMKYHSTQCGLKWNFRWVLFKPIRVIDDWDTCCEIALRRMSLDLTDEKSTLVQVMAWCRQATTHYLSQCWPRSVSPYAVIRPPTFKKMHIWKYEWKILSQPQCLKAVVLTAFIVSNDNTNIWLLLFFHEISNFDTVTDNWFETYISKPDGEWV